MEKIPDFPKYLDYREEQVKDSKGSVTTIYSLKVVWWKAVPIQYISCDEAEKQRGREVARAELMRAFYEDFGHKL